MNESTFAELAAGHALHALSASDRAAFDAALEAHPEWAVHVRTAVDTASLLSEPIASVAPAPALRDALMARIATTPQQADADAQSELPGDDTEDYAAAGPAPVIPQRSAAAGRGMRRWFTLAATFVALLALGLGAVVISQQLTRPAAVVALEQIEGASDARSASVELSDGGVATAHWSESLGEVVFVSDGLPVLDEDRTFELWLVRDGHAVPAGTFEAEQGSATTLLAEAYRPGDVIAVTVEPDGGSPTGTPSGDPILAIATA